MSFRLALFANDGLFEMTVPFPDTKAIEGVSLFFCVPLSANVLNQIFVVIFAILYLRT